MNWDSFKSLRVPTEANAEAHKEKKARILQEGDLYSRSAMQVGKKCNAFEL